MTTVSHQRLRADLSLERIDGGSRLKDHATGLQMELEEDVASALRSCLEDPARAVLDADFAAGLAELGLLDEGLTLAEITHRQSDARGATRAEERAEALAEALAFAAAEVPVYRERWLAAGLAVEQAQADDLLKLPLLDKADVRANFPDRLLPRGLSVADLLADGRALMSATSGSTDDRLECLSDTGVGSQPEGYPTFFGLPGGVTFERSATFTSPLCAGFECHLGYVPAAQRTRGNLLALNSSDDIMSFTDDEVRGVIAELEEWAPQALFLNPWYAVWLGQRAKALGLRVHRPAAVLSTYQFLTRRHRVLLEALFDAPVFNSYSATELGGYTAASQCAQGAMHVREDHVHLEILADDGVPIAPPAAGGQPTEAGRVVVTSLANRLMPLVRYQVGDLARRAPACSCSWGVEWPTIVLEGRAKEALQAADGTRVTVNALDEAMGPDAADFYCVVQEGAARFTLEVLGAHDAHLSGAIGRLEQLLGPDASVKVKRVRRFSPSRSMKFPQTRTRGRA